METNTSRCDLAIEAHEMLSVGSAEEIALEGITIEEND